MDEREPSRGRRREEGGRGEERGGRDASAHREKHDKGASVLRRAWQRRCATRMACCRACSAGSRRCASRLHCLRTRKQQP
jgi:hypothetical protein